MTARSLNERYVAACRGQLRICRRQLETAARRFVEAEQVMARAETQAATVDAEKRPKRRAR